jgi:ribosomal protein S18 acetylase RimI-like enzyme
MIKLINNLDPRQAQKMQKIFHASYAIEARLLNADVFPPLQRTIKQYVDTDTAFYGYWIDKHLAAVVEIRTDEYTTHIQSLVVSPDYFRLGIAAKLMAFVLENFPAEIVFVETGVDNIPAIKLYEKCGFNQVEEWDTKIGIRKVKLIKKLT